MAAVFIDPGSAHTRDTRGVVRYSQRRDSGAHAAREPSIEHITVANRGHTPLLNERECLAAIDAFVAHGTIQHASVRGMRLKDKVAVVGSRERDRQRDCPYFCPSGRKVALADLDSAGAHLAAAEINRQGGQAIALGVDVTDEPQVNGAVDSVVEAYGRLDVLVSNAGIQIIAPLEDLAFADWQRVLAVHLDGAFLSTRAALKQMYKQGGGSIIYMVSVHSKEASPFKAPYVTAKHGLMGLAKVVAKEGAEHGVRANVICPGFVRTPLVDLQIPQQARTLGYPPKRSFAMSC